MKTATTNQLTPIMQKSLWKSLFQHARMPRFRFMIHDRWANVLFLHWRVPVHLEAALETDTGPFVVERYDESAWIGLILLTEENVGPSIGRTRWTCVTHHGINVRTYVKGVDGNAEQDNSRDDNPYSSRKSHSPTTIATRGIHFSSLECDDEFTAFGANFFGMPYKVSQMERRYGSGIGRGWKAKDSTADKKGPTSAIHDECYRIRSERLPSCSPSFVRVLFSALNWWRPRVLQSTIPTTPTTEFDEQSNTPENGNNHFQKSQLSPATISQDHEESLSERFTVDCSWSRRCSHEPTSEETINRVTEVASNDASFHKWAAERYFVYTHKYGTNWRGKVDHEPWPLESATTKPFSVHLEKLEISGIDAYEPKIMRPIIRYMADHEPDHVGFSPGVGPVNFTMMQPV